MTFFCHVDFIYLPKNIVKLIDYISVFSIYGGEYLTTEFGNIIIWKKYKLIIDSCCFVGCPFDLINEIYPRKLNNCKIAVK